MANIAIIGAGNVGANTAFFIAERNIGPVVMYDVQEGMATGKALDMMEAAPIRGYQHAIRGTDSMDDLADADLTIIAAGSGREPGMKREDLFVKNAELIDSLASRMSSYKGTVVIATEPVDLMVMRFQKTSGLKAHRVLGLGGVLDSTRLRFGLSRALGITTENISATVIGRHSDQMMPLPEYCRVSGVPVTALMEQADLEKVLEETRSAGDVIVEMSQRASSYYGPSAAAADVVQAIAWDTRRILPVSFVWDGQYGISDVAMSLPVVLGWTGVSRVMEPKLTQEQVQALQRSADELSEMYARA
ncbi:MAG: malate dehydrogenase [Spirochaeta sp.]|jgi:malate dehydrogenase|nr:malate dehydrogenase [Spirochaeta sp.]